MAKIQEEILVIRLSKLIKNTTDDVAPLTDRDFTVNLEALILQQLIGDTVVVEIEKSE